MKFVFRHISRSDAIGNQKIENLKKAEGPRDTLVSID